MNTYEITLRDAVRHIRITAPCAFEALRTARARYGGSADITAIALVNFAAGERILTNLYRKTSEGFVMDIQKRCILNG